jgi:peptide/nickel transport system substrate-binding protein
MGDEQGDKKTWLPKPDLNRKKITRRIRKAEGATIRHANRFIIRRLTSIKEVQNEIFVWVVAIGLLIAASGLQLFWFQQSYQTTAPARDGTYAEAVLGPVDTLNPLFASSGAEQSASYLLFPRLFNYDKTGHLNNDLATDVQINDTKTVYTVTIRPDAKWDDGTKLTAKDVVFTVNLIKNPKARVDITGWDNISVKALTDTKIEFTLPAIYAPFEHALSFPIVPEHILGKVAPVSLRENSFSQKPVGCGPFKINFIQDVDTKTGRKVIHMVRNNTYYGQTTKLLRMQLHVYDTDDAIVKALASSEVNAAAGVPMTDVSKVDTKQFSLQVKPIQSGVYAILNTKSAFLQDVKLREALRVGTDSAAIRKQFPAGVPSLELPFTNNQLTGAVPKAPVYDKTEAARQLDAAGWKLNSQNVRAKDGKELKLSMVTLKNSEFENDVDILSKQWRSLGISVESKVIDPADPTQNAVQTILEPRNFDVLLYQLNIGADPDVYAYWHSSQISVSGRNYANYSNVIADDALVSARTRIEPDLRNAKYITFAKQWLTDVPAIGLYQSTTQYAVSRDAYSVTSSDELVSPLERYSTISDWAVGSRTVFKTP